MQSFILFIYYVCTLPAIKYLLERKLGIKDFRQSGLDHSIQNLLDSLLSNFYFVRVINN